MLLPLSVCAALATCATTPTPSQAPREPGAIALDDLRAHAHELGLTPSDVQDAVVSSDTTSANTGVSHVYVSQRHRGIDVWGAVMTVNVSRDGRVINRAGTFVTGIAAKIGRTTPALTPVQAVQSAARHLDLTFTEPIRIIRAPIGAAHEATLSAGGVAEKAIPVKLVLFPLEAGAVRLAWYVEVEERSTDHWWVVLIDAESGALLHKSDRVVANTTGSK